MNRDQLWKIQNAAIFANTACSFAERRWFQGCQQHPVQLWRKKSTQLLTRQLQKVDVVAVHVVPNVVAPMLTVTIIFCVRLQLFLEERSPNWSILPEEERRTFDLEG